MVLSKAPHARRHKTYPKFPSIEYLVTSAKMQQLDVVHAMQRTCMHHVTQVIHGTHTRVDASYQLIMRLV